MPVEARKGPVGPPSKKGSGSPEKSPSQRGAVAQRGPIHPASGGTEAEGGKQVMAEDTAGGTGSAYSTNYDPEKLEAQAEAMPYPPQEEGSAPVFKDREPRSWLLDDQTGAMVPIRRGQSDAALDKALAEEKERLRQAQAGEEGPATSTTNSGESSRA